MAKMLGQDILTQAEFDKFYQEEFLAHKEIIGLTVTRALYYTNIMKISIAVNAVLLVLGGVALFFK